MTTTTYSAYRRDVVSTYSVPVTGLVPDVLHAGQTDVDAELAVLPWARYSVYRQDLIRDATRLVAEIHQQLDRYADSPTPISDLLYVEPPDDVSYQDAYTWRRVDIAIIEGETEPNSGTSPLDIWR